MKTRLLALAAIALALSGCNALNEPTDSAGGRSQTTPTVVSGTQQWIAVAAGYQHTCALDTEGKAWCWGSNQYGQLGVLTASPCSDVGTCMRRPVQILGDQQFVKIAAGLAHNCALTASGEAWCWGGGYETGNAGFLGNGAITRSEMPVRALADSAFTEIDAGIDNTCALTASGQAWCWGRNASGELGTGNQFARTIPTVIPGDARFTRISVGGEHVCGVRDIGTVLCWGSNRFGQIGNGNVTYNLVGRVEVNPQRVEGTTTFTAVSAGGDHSCAIRADGEIECWGLNANAGQLGDRSALTHRGVPGPINGERTYSRLAAGFATSCATTEASVSYCWGSNFFGAMGVGNRDTLIYEIPVQTLGGPYVELTGGGSHMCGLTAGGQILCWGDKKYGQTGN